MNLDPTSKFKGRLLSSKLASTADLVGEDEQVRRSTCLFGMTRSGTALKDWIRLVEAAVRKSHRIHGDIELPTTLKVLPKT